MNRIIKTTIIVCAIICVVAGIAVRVYFAGPPGDSANVKPDAITQNEPIIAPAPEPTPESESESEAESEQELTPPEEDNVVEPSITFSDAELLSCAGDVYYGVYYFGKETYYSSGNSAKTPAASVIKVFIMQYIYEQAANGVITLDDNIDGQNIGRLVRAMIQRSDNAATNVLIDHFGMSTINASFQNKGYTDTSLERKMLDYDARGSGKDNYTSLDDVMRFLKALYLNRDEYPYSEMLDILKGQTIKTKIPLFLPSGIVVANKTGELDTVENDVGVVFTENGDFAIVVLTNNIYNSAKTRTAIGRLTQEALQNIPTE